MKSKIISFIIGGMIGFCLWSIQVNASPIGATTDAEMSVSEARKILKDNAIDVPEDIREVCEDVSEETGVLAEVLEAMAWKESRFTPNVKSKDGKCIGLLQVNPTIHKERMKRLKANNLYDIEDNVRVGGDYLQELCESNSLETALNKYNGSTNGNTYGKKVIEVAQALEVCYWD